MEAADKANTEAAISLSAKEVLKYRMEAAVEETMVETKVAAHAFEETIQVQQQVAHGMHACRRLYMACRVEASHCFQMQ